MIPSSVPAAYFAAPTFAADELVCQVLDVTQERELAHCLPLCGVSDDDLSAIQDVDAWMVGPVQPGDLLLVHHGVALAWLGHGATEVM